MTKLKALVTGGGGFIGSHLCNKLLKNNYEVIAYDDLSNGSGIKNLNPIIHGTGNQTRDFTYVEDTCEGIILADQSKNALGDTFNIGQGKEFKINNIAKMMIKKYEESTGKQLKLKLNHQKLRRGDVLRHRS